MLFFPSKEHISVSQEKIKTLRIVWLFIKDSKDICVSVHMLTPTYTPSKVIVFWHLERLLLESFAARISDLQQTIIQIIILSGFNLLNHKRGQRWWVYYLESLPCTSVLKSSWQLLILLGFGMKVPASQEKGLFVDIQLEHHLDSGSWTRWARHSLPLLSVLVLLVVNVPERTSTDSTCSWSTWFTTAS